MCPDEDAVHWTVGLWEYGPLDYGPLDTGPLDGGPLDLDLQRSIIPLEPLTSPAALCCAASLAISHQTGCFLLTEEKRKVTSAGVCAALLTSVSRCLAGGEQSRDQISGQR